MAHAGAGHHAVGENRAAHGKTKRGLTVIAVRADRALKATDAQLGARLGRAAVLDPEAPAAGSRHRRADADLALSLEPVAGGHVAAIAAQLHAAASCAPAVSARRCGRCSPSAPPASRRPEGEGSRSAARPPRAAWARRRTRSPSRGSRRPGATRGDHRLRIGSRRHLGPPPGCGIRRPWMSRR